MKTLRALDPRELSKLEKARDLLVEIVGRASSAAKRVAGGKSMNPSAVAARKRRAALKKAAAAPAAAAAAPAAAKPATPKPPATPKFNPATVPSAPPAVAPAE